MAMMILMVTGMSTEDIMLHIHMAKADGSRTPVTYVSFFEPTHRDGVCVSLEEWGARIFKPHNKKSYVMLKWGVK